MSLPTTRLHPGGTLGSRKRAAEGRLLTESGVSLGKTETFRNEVVVTVAQPWEYTKKINEFYNLKGWTLWYVNYVLSSLIKLVATFSPFEMFSRLWSMTPPRHLGPSYLFSFQSRKPRYASVTFWSSRALAGIIGEYFVVCSN